MVIDVPDIFADLGMAKDVTEVVKVVVDNSLITFYYFLRVGRYEVKGKRTEMRQTKQF